MEITLSKVDGRPVLTPPGVQPRLERAFAASAGRGMLDLLRYGLPAGASPVLAWLRERTRERMMQCLRALRRGEDMAAALSLSAQQVAALLESLPPVGGEAVGSADVQAWFASLAPALEWLAARECCTVEQWLCRLGEGWQQLGMLCFHLAENAGEGADAAPFAFLATFVHKVGQDGRARHAPLGLAARLLADDTPAMLDLLRPLRTVAAQSPFLAELINSQAVYKPCGWNARRAYDFLETLPLLDAAGIETRMVNLWKTQPPRVELEVRVDMAEPGAGKPDAAPSVNVNSLLRFYPRVVLGDYNLTDEELEQLLAADEDGLVRFRGEWVRLDREKLSKLMDSWRQAARMAAGGIPLLVGLRYLLGKRSEALPQLPPQEDGMRAVAGARLSLALSNLHFGNTAPDLPPALAATLRSYQLEGVRFLLNVTEAGFGACLADDMGLGKTLQVISWLAHLERSGALGEGKGAALIVAPASLLVNWQQELRRFAPQLNVAMLHPYALNRQQADYLRTNPAWLMRRAHVALTTYGIATRNELLTRSEYPAIVLDEAQAIKNADSQRTRAVCRLSSPRRVALTGTPVENSLSELRSLFEFLNPGLLGTEKEFNALVQSMGNDYTPLRRLVRPFLLRRLKSDPALLPELPPKTETPAYCLLTPEQTRLYAHEVENLRAVVAEPDPQTRLSLVLPILGRLKQICNHPAQYCGESWFDPAASGKFTRLAYLARSIASAGDCCLVFTQYRSMIEPLHEFLAEIFGAPGLTLHGGTPIAERQRLVAAFQAPGGPRFFILSLKAAGTGLTLTRARHVIHFDRWWNPAVENQASDRAYRIGQQQPVFIHPLICRGTIEENIHNMLTRKSAMADNLLSGGLEKLLLHLSPEELLHCATLEGEAVSG
ncbi:MAG: DEAD/DEAH box helicase [Akkermansia sp.]|nr:DEAD/DEAH box helicase [Akkermansia sp.]